MKSRYNLVETTSSTLSVRQQCSLLSVSRSSFYYQVKEEKPENLEMMRIMDKHLTMHPTERGGFDGISAEWTWICSWP